MNGIEFKLKTTKSSSLKRMTEEKIATFAFGNTNKTKFQIVLIN